MILTWFALLLKASLYRTWTKWICWGLLLVAMLDASASGQRVLSVSWTRFTAPGVNLPPRRLTTSKFKLNCNTSVNVLISMMSFYFRSVFLKPCDIFRSSEFKAHKRLFNSSFHMNLSLGALFFPAFPCTRWPTLTWAGSWRVRRSRKHFVLQSKYRWRFEMFQPVTYDDVPLLVRVSESWLLWKFWATWLVKDVYLGVGACW